MVFVKADSQNLPVVENIMTLEYMATNDSYNIAEIRGAKALLSSRSSYLESAVGFVEVSRLQQICTVRAQVVPEHKVRLQNYKVTAVLDEQRKVIISTECDSCAAAAGGCKHSLVLLFWMEKKHSEPSTTDVKCYWTKPKLKAKSLEPILISEMYKKNKQVTLKPKSAEVLLKFVAACKQHNVKNSLIYLNSGECDIESYNLYDMAIDFVSRETNNSFENFLIFVNNRINENVIVKIQEETLLQSQCKLWHNIRQGRITGSKIYEASVCNTDGVLIQQILGGYKVPETKAIRRGKMLEKIVLKQLESELNVKIRESGIILINGIMGASPDGINDDIVVEIKCPSTINTFKNYVKDGQIKEKFMAQIQLQMYAAHKKKVSFVLLIQIMKKTISFIYFGSILMQTKSRS